LSPDGTRVALDGWKEGQNGSDAHILVVSLNDGVVEDLGPGAMPSWSADETWLAYSRYAPIRGVYIRPVQGGFEELIEAGGWGIRWSPDGKRLAYARGGNVIIYDPGTKTKHAVFPEDQPLPYHRIYWNCGWSPDSKRICFKGQWRSEKPDSRSSVVRDEVAIVTVDGPPQLFVCCDATDVVEKIAWRSDGNRVVIPMAGQLFEFTRDAEQRPRQLAGLPMDRTNGGTCWSRDGNILIFISYWRPSSGLFEIRNPYRF
jgi:hypothetical protein